MELEEEEVCFTTFLSVVTSKDKFAFIYLMIVSPSLSYSGLNSE